jgi:hypothetical protein
MTRLWVRLRRTPTLAVLVMAAASLVVFVVMQPWFMLAATTPTGGDMGAHVYGPAYLRDVLLPQGRLLGWSQDWFAGFPVFYFYFPIPSLVIVFLDLFIPYGAAFKLVTSFGLLAMPPAVYFHVRAMKLGKTVATIASGAAVVFIFFESFSIYGGNLASTLAGEFSYAWSFSLSLVYLGLLIKAVADDKKYVKWAALVLALTALTHILTTIVAVFASLFVLAWKKAVWKSVAIWAWGFAIAGFWALPLLVRIGLTSDMGWQPLSAWSQVFPVEVWLLFPLAIPGAIWAMRTTRRAGPMIGATLLPVIYFPLPNILPEILPSIFDGERWKLWNGRLLPYWYFGLAFFAAIALGATVVWLSRRIPARLSAYWVKALILLVVVVATGLAAVSHKLPGQTWIAVALFGATLFALSFMFPPTVGSRPFLTVTASALLILGAASSVTYVDGWSRWNFEGYEAKAPWPEYEQLMKEINALPDGRVMWEANSSWNEFGTPMSPMLIPYWSEYTHQSMEGLFFESSITTPFHFINHSEMSFRPSNPIPGLRYHTFDMERGLVHMDTYGVRYYVSITPEAAEKAQTIDGFELISTSGRFNIFRLPETELVTVATKLPAVYDVPDRGLLASLIGSETVRGPDGEPLPSFHDMALAWYDDIANLDRVVVDGGPTEWPRIADLSERPNVPLSESGTVSNIVVEDHRVSFTTTAVGVPHVVKISYFPNWKATGAEGPWRATPSLMVVVPTQAEVVLEFSDTWVETGGKILSLGGVGALAVVGVLARRRFRGAAPDES